jgi:hypothetical protein
MPGLMGSIENGVLTNTDDMFSHAMGVIHNDIYELNKDHYAGYMWVSVLDWKTCIVCGDLDSNIYTDLPVRTAPPVDKSTSGIAVDSEDEEMIKMIEGLPDDPDERYDELNKRIDTMINKEKYLSGEYRNKLKTIEKDWFENILTDGERVGTVLYTSSAYEGINQYKRNGEDYKKLNQQRPKGTGTFLSTIKYNWDTDVYYDNGTKSISAEELYGPLNEKSFSKALADLDSGLKKFLLDKSMVVTRGEGFDDTSLRNRFSKYKTGEVVDLLGYTSTGVKPISLSSFNKGVELTIIVPKGTTGASMIEHSRFALSGEAEWVGADGLKLEILARKDSKNNNGDVSRIQIIGRFVNGNDKITNENNTPESSKVSGVYLPGSQPQDLQNHLKDKSWTIKEVKDFMIQAGMFEHEADKLIKEWGY